MSGAQSTAGSTHRIDQSRRRWLTRNALRAGRSHTRAPTPTRDHEHQQQDPVHFQVQHQVKGGQQRTGRAAERRDEIELTGTLAARTQVGHQ